MRQLRLWIILGAGVALLAFGIGMRAHFQSEDRACSVVINVLRQQSDTRYRRYCTTASVALDTSSLSTWLGGLFAVLGLVALLFPGIQKSVRRGEELHEPGPIGRVDVVQTPVNQSVLTLIRKAVLERPALEHQPLELAANALSQEARSEHILAWLFGVEHSSARVHLVALCDSRMLIMRAGPAGPGTTYWTERQGGIRTIRVVGPRDDAVALRFGTLTTLSDIGPSNAVREFLARSQHMQWLRVQNEPADGLPVS